MALSFRSKNKIAEKEDTLRNSMWPNADQRLWDRKAYGGFVTIPKTMPFICRILDEMSKNHPLGSTYQALWAFTWDNNAFVKLNRPSEVAYAAGFTGQRGERTLYDRLKRLEDFGFIEVAPTAINRFGFIFIPNPHPIIMNLRAAKLGLLTVTEPELLARAALIPDGSLASFLSRAIDIGCKDIVQLLKGPEQSEDGEEEDAEDEPVERPIRRRAKPKLKDLEEDDDRPSARIRDRRRK
ncbi:MAG TPA: hypothetical protein VM639_14300 [Dongiaceae bacterium]|nr:hypothetical protein [Dongiaceae bacterium]